MNTLYRQYLLEGEQAGMPYTLAAPRNVPMGIAGAQIGNRAGSSLEFKEHREYQPGDDLRRVDWGAFARSDKLAIKLYREEVCPHLDVVVDCSRSMALKDSAKAQATLGLAAVFAVAAENAGFTHSAWMAKEGCRKLENGGEIPSAWQGIDFEYPGNLHDSLVRLPPRWHSQGIRVLISDLLWLGDPLLTLCYFTERATSVIVIQVLAESDVNPPEQGNVELIDSETDQLRELFVDSIAQSRYRDALSRHQQNWYIATRKVGAVLVPLVAERLIRTWRLEELVTAEILR